VSLSCDFDKYVRLLKPVASLSHLFTDNSTPYVDSKFVERLYLIASGARDTAGDNSSFDAIAPDLIGVGVKTFCITKTARNKFEKVAEFTASANAGAFDGLDADQSLRKAIQLRNARLSSDAIAYGIDVSRAIYHCLLRMEGAAMIHEEPMSLVEESALYPIDSSGAVLTRNDDKCYGYSDGKNIYKYSKSKRVLLKAFPVIIPAPSAFGGLINLPINRDILQQLMVGGLSDVFPAPVEVGAGPVLTPDQDDEFVFQYGSDASDNHVQDDPGSYDTLDGETDLQTTMIIKRPTDFIILPLYSTRDQEVPEKSGINQWNAGGRVRSFGEAYIPVPSWIHKSFPGFLPDRDQSFRLRLQDGTVVSAKVCQQGSKALMTDPNDKLCRWLYTAIEPGLSYDRIMERLPQKRPYTYKDLVTVGKDCVKVSKVSGKPHQYEMTFCGLGEYEKFLSAATGL
jgi:hypothetical protein